MAIKAHFLEGEDLYEVNLDTMQIMIMERDGKGAPIGFVPCIPTGTGRYEAALKRAKTIKAERG